MQKHFLTGLKITTVSLLALTATADPSGPTAKLAGNLAVNAYSSQQKIRTDRDTTFSTTGELRAEINAKAKNGMNYGAIGTINLDNTDPARIKQAYILMNHEKYGDWLVGDTDSAAHLMGYDGADLMAGLQGPTASSFDKVVNVTRGVSMKNNMATKLPSATKVTYLSPIKDGWRVGFSYTPNEGLNGLAVRTNRSSNTNNTSAYSSVQDGLYAVNALEGAVSYVHQLNTGGKLADVNWYVGGKMARVKARNTVRNASAHPVRAMQAGLVLDYGDYQFGGGYFNNGRSFQRKTETTKNWTNLEGYNVAFGKKLDAVPGAYVSIGHTGTNRRVTGGYARGDVTSVGMDYDIAKGLVVYTSVDMFAFKAPKAHQALTSSQTQHDYLDNAGRNNLNNNLNNRGALFTLGTKLRF